MLIFHEGLPGSGKSYEACINRIIPALLKGRKVFAYIEGLDHEKFAEVTGLPLERVKELLVQLDKEQVKSIYKHVENDSLVVIDELQDFFPSGRQKLDQGITEFVTQHRHRGLDIIAMGQSHKDCHNLWKRRIDQLIIFVKLDTIGMPSSYTWTTYKQVNERLVKLLSGKGGYDPKYFGLYASHTRDTDNTDTYTDKRANVLNGAYIRYVIPAFFILGFFAIFYLWGFFHSSPVKMPSSKAVATNPDGPADKKQPFISPDVKTVAVSGVKNDPADYLGEYLAKYRPRLSAYVHNARKFVATVDFLDDNNRVYERLSSQAIMAFGYSIQPKPFGLWLISPKGVKHVVTSYPIDRTRGSTTPLQQAKF